MFAVERKTPPKTNRKIQRKYPFKYLDVGDSFFVPAPTAKARQLVSTAASVYKQANPNWSYMCRKIDKDDEPHGLEGIRVWCTALARLPFQWQFMAEYAPDEATDNPGGWQPFNGLWVPANDPTSCEDILEKFKAECQHTPGVSRFYIGATLVAETDGKGGLVMRNPLPSRLRRPEPAPTYLVAGEG